MGALGPGSAFAGLVVERLLGSGGMASVFLVKDADGARHALKVLANGYSPASRERLKIEGRIQGAVRHPNVVSVTDVLDIDGQVGLLMDYVDGPDLAAYLSGRTLQVDEADELALGILAGVEAAHRAGMVHRDLKPANILLHWDGGRIRPRIADFGIAKVLAEDPAQLEVLTRTGQSMGSPSYMAPEQIRDAKNVDQRADVFSLGAILYELATGQRAFFGADIFTIWQKIQCGDYPPPTSIHAQTPDRMVQAICGALQVSPHARIGSCEALREVWQGTRTWSAPAAAATKAPLDLATATFAPQAAPAPSIPLVPTPPPLPPPPLGAIRLIRDELGAAEWAAWTVERHEPEAARSRYVELEAEVERGPRWSRFLPGAGRDRVQWHREPSLSRAILTTEAPFAVLLGPAGSGKSMALRAAARAMLDRAEAARGRIALPILIPLQRLAVPSGQPIDPEVVRQFVTGELARWGMAPLGADGWDERIDWVFLFDGFDEIPELLSSTWRDDAVQDYMTALQRFVVTTPSARGIVATRPLRGQGRFRWPQLRVLPLSEERTHAFLEAGLHTDTLVQAAASWLASGSRTERSAGQNPLLLTLLMRFARQHTRMPQSLYELFRDTVARRLDAVLGPEPDGIDRDMVLRVAATIGSAMADDRRLGLEVRLTDLLRAVQERSPVLASRVPAALAVLARAGLGRLRERGTSLEETVFGFSHRRLQEYFAVEALRSGELTTPVALFEDYRWRETAVMLLQTRAETELGDLCERATALLDSGTEQIGDHLKQASALTAASEDWQTRVEPLLHLLGILQDGLGERLDAVPPSLRQAAGAFVSRVMAAGGPLERHEVLEVIGIAPAAVQRDALHHALSLRSLWSLERAVQHAAWLPESDPALEQQFRWFLLWMALRGELIPRRATLQTWLGRLPEPTGLLQSLDLLVWAPWFDRAGVLTLFALAGALPGAQASVWPMAIGFAALAVGMIELLERPFLQKAIDTASRSRDGATVEVLLVGVVLRLAIFTVLVILLGSTAVWTPRSLLLMLALAIPLLGTYLPSARGLATAGRFTARPLWPLVSIIGPVFLLLATRIGSGFVANAVGSVGVVMGLGWIALASGISVDQLINVVFAGCGAAFVGMTVPALINAALDQLALRRLETLERGSLTGAAFLLELGRFRTPGMRRRFIERARDREWIQPTDAVRTQLADLAGKIDALLNAARAAKLARPRWRSFWENDNATAVDHLRALVQHKPLEHGTTDALMRQHHRPKAWSVEVLDELYRLHESLGPADR